MADFPPNEMQQKAIDKLQGQVMLLAGPGTGKTFTVIHRIEAMLSKGIQPSSILCLTFSDVAANEMRQRLIKKMGVIASSVDIYTYHSFCNEIIKTYPAQFELGAGVRLISDIEKILLMRECIDEAELEFFTPSRADKYFFAKNFIGYIEKLKSQRVTKEEYLANIETNPTLLPRIKELEAEIYEREQRGETRNKGRYGEIDKIKTNIEKSKELWKIYELYSNKMVTKSLIDFSDMINFVLDSFEQDRSFLEEVSNKYRYFLVDEYQDTNDLQNSIIFNLLDGNSKKNIFVVGDDDQIIYGFQGARIDSIENFLTRYPETEVICLKESNRSTQSILDFSYELIKQDEKRLENNPKFQEKDINKQLTAVNQKITCKDKKIRRYHFGEKLQEMNHIVDEIEALIKSENCPLDDDGKKNLAQIAIISKKRAELQQYMEMLKGKNIPCQIDEGKSIFAIRSSILIYFYLKALNNHILSSDKLFGLMLSEPFKIDLEDYNKILHEQQSLREDRNNDFISLMQTLEDWKDEEKIRDFIETFNDLKLFANNNPLRNTIIEILNRTGILEYFYSEPKNKMENLMGIKKVLEVATEYENQDSTRSFRDFVKYLDDCLEDEIDITTDKKSITENAIQLTTYHGSKGREFEFVYLPNLISRNWENFSMPGEYKLITDKVLDDKTAEERKDSELLKLLFVGITRAKHSLTISFADADNGKTQQITKYLVPLSDYDFEDKNFDFDVDDFVLEFVRSISREVYDNKQAFLTEIRERVDKTVLSPSRLNDYLDCPRKFFYTKILGIDVEDRVWDGANFGTLIHALLEKAVRVAKTTGSYPEIEEIREGFTKGLLNARFSNQAQKEKVAKLGMETINNYYPHFSQIPVSRVEDIEFNFYGVEVEGNTIKGMIDRIEKNSDGTYSLYDYKTGTPVSANQIDIGGHKEGYFNQLCFYKYAYEKFSGNKVSDVGIIYVENHAKSVYKTLTKEDMQYIENKIKEVYANIKDLKFDPIPEDKQGPCKFCAYKHLCKLDVI